MRQPGPEIPAVFASRGEAESAVDELFDEHLADDHLWRAVHAANHRALEEDSDRMIMRNIARGIAVGVPIGAAFGVLIMYVGQWAIGFDASFASFVFGCMGGFMAGGFFGVVYGVARSSHILYAREPYSDVPLGTDEMLVVAHGHGDSAHVREVMEQHGGRLVA